MSTVMKQAEAIYPQQLLQEFLTGLIIGFLEIVLALSLASLVFNGEIKSYLAMGVGIALVTAIVHTIVVALFTRSPRFISSIQDNSTVLIGIITGSIVATNSGQDNLLATVLLAIFTATIVTGLFIFLIGRFKLGHLARFVPYPVIGGFLGGTGWLLFQGSFSIMSDYALVPSNLSMLMQMNQVMLWLPGVIFAVAMFFAVRQFSHFLTLPFTFIVGFIAFYIGLSIFGISFSAASEVGYFMQVEANTQALPGLRPNLFLQADWTAIIGQSGNIAALAIVTFLATLLNISGLELAFNEDADLNYELQTVGSANLVSGFLGGMIGYHAASISLLGHRIGGKGRLGGILAALICGVVLIVGAPFMRFVPSAFLGGIILFLGLDFLNDWLIQGHKKFSTGDFIIVLLIVITIAFAGFLIGVGLGLILAIMLFVYNYSRTDIFQFVMSGAELSSNVERSAHHEQALNELGEQIHVMELRGFIFFGTVNHILEALRKRISDTDIAPLRYCILDFKRVTGLDSSAVLGFQKLQSLAIAEEFTLIFTEVHPDISRELSYMNFEEDDKQLRLMTTLDKALGWCEDTLIAEHGITVAHVASTLKIQLQDWGFDGSLVKSLNDYIEKRTFDAGDVLIAQGDDANTIYFIEIGQVSIFIEEDHGESIPIRTLQMGTVVGEIGFYHNHQRTASVIADTVTIAYALSRENFEKMKQENPQLSIAVNELLVRIVSDRLNRLNKTLIGMSRV